MTTGHLARRRNERLAPLGLRWCPRCDGELPLDQFYFNESTGRYESGCKPCRRPFAPRFNSNGDLERQCPTCMQWKVESLLRPHRGGGRVAKRRQCLECFQDRQRTNANRPEVILARQRRHRRNRDAHNAASRAYHASNGTFRRYGITEAQKEAQRLYQGDKCLGCSKPMLTDANTDHDHETGRLRGLLCGNCNRALGLVKDSPSTLRSLAAYLEAGGAWIV